MGINKKRDKKNFEKMKKFKKQQKNFKPQVNLTPQEGVVDFLNQSEIIKLAKPDKNIKKCNLKPLPLDNEDQESASEKAESEQSEELGFGHELDQLIYDKEYDDEGNYIIKPVFLSQEVIIFVHIKM